MHLEKPLDKAPLRRVPLQERVLGELAGERDDALVFAASSVINEITAPNYDGAVVVRDVSTDRGTYTLRGSRVFGADGGQPVVLVYATPLPVLPEPAPPPDIRSCFHLTRKEARVAVLLADRKTNEQIARELCVSTHTARHHTQSVLGKLGISSRREVAERLGI